MPEFAGPAPIHTPWTDKQVEALNRYQDCAQFHAYTCGKVSGHQPLYATTGGWKCWDCSYTQNWALESSFALLGLGTDGQP